MIVKRTAPDLFDKVSAALEQGGREDGVIILQCDTIYGLVGIYPQAAGRIRAIKGREAAKAFILLLADASWLGDLTTSPLPPSLQPFWPGPLTLIMPARAGGTIALRVPQDDFLRRLLARLQKPLISTSVNKAGEAALSQVDSIKKAFQEQVDLIVDSGDCVNPLPSTILDITCHPYKIVRQGVLVLPSGVLQ